MCVCVRNVHTPDNLICEYVCTAETFQEDELKKDEKRGKSSNKVCI